MHVQGGLSLLVLWGTTTVVAISFSCIINDKPIHLASLKVPMKTRLSNVLYNAVALFNSYTKTQPYQSFSKWLFYDINFIDINSLTQALLYSKKKTQKFSLMTLYMNSLAR